MSSVLLPDHMDPVLQFFDERPDEDPRRFAGQAGEGRPRIRRPLPGVAGK